MRTSIEEADQVGGDVKPIQVSLRGSELAKLEPLSQKLMAEIGRVPGTADLDTSEEEPQAEVRVVVNRKAAADLGLDLGTVVYTYLDGLGTRFERWWTRRTPDHARAGAGAPVSTR